MKNLEAKTSKQVNKIKNIISLEDVTVNGNEVVVDYLFNDNFLEARIDLNDLKQFALNRGMNEFVNDGCVNGEHEQTETTQNIDDYLNENLNEVVLAYLVEYPLDSVILQLDAMALRLTA